MSCAQSSPSGHLHSRLPSPPFFAPSFLVLPFSITSCTIPASYPSVQDPLADLDDFLADAIIAMAVDFALES